MEIEYEDKKISRITYNNRNSIGLIEVGVEDLQAINASLYAFNQITSIYNTKLATEKDIILVREADVIKSDPWHTQSKIQRVP